MEKQFNIKKKGNYFVAFDTEDKKRSYGKININTGNCIGGTLCFNALRLHLENHLKSNKIPQTQKEVLVDKVLEQIKTDVNTGDVTAIEELLKFVPVKYLKGYLPE